MEIRKNIYIMYAIALMQGMVFYGPIATLYRQAAGVNIFEITIIESISMALTVLMELPMGLLADRIGYRNTMVGCCALYFVSKLIFWRADGFFMFLLERVLLSVVMAGMSGVDSSIIYLSCAKGKSQSAFGVYNNLGTLGMLLASGVYTLFIGDDYRLAGFLTVISYGIAAALALLLTDVRPESALRGDGRKFIELLRQTLNNKSLLMIVLGVALLNEAHQTIAVFLGQLKYESCGMTSSEIGVAFIALTLSGLCGGLSARLTRRLGETKFGIALFVCACVACAGAAVTRFAFVAVAMVILLRIAYSLLGPLQLQIQNREITSRDRATALSINAVLAETVGIGTNIAFGGAAKCNLTLALLMGAGFCAAGLCLFAGGCRGAKARKSARI